MFAINANGQFIYLTNTSGTSYFGSLGVTVTSAGITPTLSGSCPGGPLNYRVGQYSSPGSYSYTCSIPVYSIKVNAEGINSGAYGAGYGGGEYMQMYVNGLPYFLTTADMTSYTECGSTTDSPCYLYSGLLMGPLSGPLYFDAGNGGDFTIKSCAPIYSFEVTCGNTDGGIGYGIAVDTLPSGACVGNNAPVCTGSTLDLFDHGDSTGATYYWYGPDGFTSTLQNPIITGATLANLGVYSVIKTLTGITDTFSTYAIIGSYPALSLSSNSPVCHSGDTLRLFAGPDSSGETFTWVGPRSFSSPLQDPVIAGFATTDTGIYTATANWNGCIVTAPIDVTASAPPTITGASLCVSLTAGLSDSSSGGMWRSSNTAIATIGSTSGIVVAVLPGTSVISYSFGPSCPAATATVNILSISTPITGILQVCGGQTTDLGEATTGGTWSSTNTLAATISTGGAVAGIGSGTTTIKYTIPATGCSATATLTVNPLPPAITGTVSVCVGSTTTLSNSTSGGTWSSSATTTATVNSGSGIVTGIIAGTAVITYMLPTGCIATAIVTVNPLPLPITGTTIICGGATTTLTEAITGGTWSSGNLSTASIGITSGVITGGSISVPGTTTITYSIAGSCITSIVVTVNTEPAAITGASSLCAGATITLSAGSTGSPSGGVWSGASPMVGIGTATGIVTGVVSGTAAISYTLPDGCSSTVAITVLSSPLAIAGIMSTCIGATTALSDTITGGYWTSGNTSVAIVDPLLGIVTGAATGTTTVSYTLSTGCGVAAIVTINNAPLPVSGTLILCPGSSTALSDAVTGGSWSGGGTTVATVDTSGKVYGVNAGTATISYSVGTCVITSIVTVNASPPAIRGVTEVCVGLATLMSDAATGGTWSSGNAAIASVVRATGILTGGAAGTATISYTLPDGCAATTSETVNTTPSPITGVMQVCPGATTPLSDAGGGSWSSGNTAVASVGTTGAVGGVAVGTASIIYSIGVGCSISTTVTVNPLPAAISGTEILCTGTTTALSDGSGTWSATSGGIATVGSATGIVTGVSGGTAVITYTSGSTGCTARAILTVNAQPASITGTLTICQGATTILSDHTTGGMWSSGSTGIATVGSTGTVTGLAPGTSVITYTIAATGCATHATLTVNSLPSPITATLSLCMGSTTALHDATSSGLWTYSPGTIATVGSVSGVVSGVSAGTQVISYTLPTGCATIAVVTVNPLPGITGPTAECVGAVIAEAATPSGGTWSSSATTVAAVILGSVTGITTGTTIITYTSPAGCKATTTVTVSLSPGGIIGSSAVCAGDTTTLSDAVGGGEWSNSNVATATVGSLNGTVTGVAFGTSIITYSLGSTGCMVTKILTVNVAPARITGTRSLCVGTTTALADATTGGTWSSATVGIATISGTGIVAGGAAGIDTITYSHGGCSVGTTVTINLTPTAITGAGSVCAGDSIMLSDAVSGGIWTSSNTGIAIVDAGSYVTGISPDTVTITYSLGTGCAVTKIITVNPISPITGGMGLCLGTTTTLTDAVTGGTWNSGTTAISTVNSVGVVTGILAGTSVITYTTATGCSATALVTVNLAPSAISGTLQVCAGATAALGNTAGSGGWISTNTAIATISTTGIVTGIVPGTSIITYSLGGGCIVSAVVTIDAVPAGITGVISMCAGATTALSETSTGGVWSSGSTMVATVSGSGLVNGVSGGTVAIRYAFATGCTVTVLITVNPLPGLITGTSHLCAGLTTTLASATTGGSWGSGSTSIASIDPATGNVTGIAPGTAVITYALSSGCSSITTITINAAPSLITGSTTMCEGSGTVLSDSSVGGGWSSSNSGVATITGTGAVTSGVLSGTATISYTVGGCAATAVVTVNAPPEPLSSTRVCIGSVETLADLPVGGTWSSSDAAIATIDETEGVLTGVSAGTATIAYSLGAGCTITATVTVQALPGSIAGTPEVCVGYTTTLSDGAGGGLWSSGSTGIATVTGLGVITGVAGGPATISYTSIATGCAATRLVTVVAIPPISGISDMCAFSSTAIVSDGITGGTWTSTSVTVSTAGMVTPYSAGPASLTYTIPLGCYVTASFIVHPLPGPVTGISRFCRGSTVTLTDTSFGGTWGSSNTAVAPVSSGGSVAGLSAGTAVISYTLGSGCMETETITVDSFPSAGVITGLSGVCVGATIVLTDLSAGGTWSSSNITVATVIPMATGMGIVSGVSPGVDTIKYIISNTCGSASTSKTMTINPLPVAYTVTGGGNYCAGGSGVHIGLSGSNTGINYQLYHGATLTGSVAGTGITADFGLQTAAGVYTVVATNTSTGCTNNMLGTATVTVTLVVIPAVTIAPGLSDTICAGSTITFTATPLNGGSLPAYQWLVNSTQVSGATTGSYTYTPVNGDEVKAMLISSAACATPDTVSDSIVIVVVTPVIPTVTINASPGTTILQGQSDTLAAIISGGGPSPAYQWEIDGNPIAGATMATFVNNYNTNDTVTCIVSVGGICNSQGLDSIVILVNNVGVNTLPTNETITLAPNPNNGTFTIKSSLGTISDEEVSLEITDLLGQVIYKNKVTANSGKINEQINLINVLANGMYILSIHSATKNKVFHIVIEQ